MARERKNEISYMNVLLCLFVIFIHVISLTLDVLTPGTVKYTFAMLPWRAVSFVVPGFIMLSGLKLFLTGKDKKGYFSYLKSRFFSIFVPYVIAFAVYYGLFMYTADYPPDIAFIAKSFVLGTVCYHLYFLIILFQFDLLFPLWKLIINKCSPMIVVPFSLLITIIFEKWSPEMIRVAGINSEFVMPDRMIMTYIGYFIVGCYIGKYYDEFAEILNKNFKTICVVFAISFSLFLYYTYLAFNGLEWIQFTNEVHQLYCMTVLVFLYAVFLKVKGRMPKMISLIDKASFEIYLYHVLMLYISEFVMSKLSVTSHVAAFGIRVIFGYVITIPLCIAFSIAKSKIKSLKIKPQM